MDALVNSLGSKEQDLLRETEAERMATLDEDSLVDLHGGSARPATEYVGIYRREGTPPRRSAGIASIARQGGHAEASGRTRWPGEALATWPCRGGASAARLEPRDRSGFRSISARDVRTTPGSSRAQADESAQGRRASGEGDCRERAGG